MINSQFVRFFAVSIFGLCIDIGIAWSLATVFSVPTWIAAIVGFLVAAIGNYIINASWTFSSRTQKRSLSLAQGGAYLLTVASALAVRLVAVLCLSYVIPHSSTGTAFTLFLAAGISFLYTFLLSKNVVFKAQKNLRDTDL